MARPKLSQSLHGIGLDTAWLAGDKGDSSRLRLTEHQVSLLTTAERGAPLPGFRLALMHHRLDDLADGVVVLATGCLYEGDEGHHYPERVPDDRSERGMFWGDDALLYESARSGRLRLHRVARGWRFDEDNGVKQEPPPRRDLIDFTLERQRHARFVGREDVLAQLDQWLLGPGPVGWVVVTGGPGMGKSAILSQWLARREAASVTVPHHFVRRQVASWDQPEVIAASLATQIEVMFPALRDSEARPEGRLIDLIGRVSKQLGEAGRLVVLVDGLDETRAEPGDNPLPHFLPHVVPAGIRLLCAMRPTYPHLRWIEARSPARRIDLDDRQWATSNETVVRGFWQAAAPEYEPPLPAKTVASAIERAEGNVLRAVMLHDALQGLPAQERRADRIPRGLGGLISEIWDRAAAHPGVRAGLGLLCAAQEALSLDVVADLAGWSADPYEERERFLREARQLLLEEPASWSGAVAYRPRHDWVRELMVERLGAAILRAHHGTLARILATWPAPAEPPRRRVASLRAARWPRSPTPSRRSLSTFA